MAHCWMGGLLHEVPAPDLSAYLPIKRPAFLQIDARKRGSWAKGPEFNLVAVQIDPVQGLQVRQGEEFPEAVSLGDELS